MSNPEDVPTPYVYLYTDQISGTPIYRCEDCADSDDDGIVVGIAGHQAWHESEDVGELHALNVYAGSESRSIVFFSLTPILADPARLAAMAAAAHQTVHATAARDLARWVLELADQSGTDRLNGHSDADPHRADEHYNTDNHEQELSA